VGINRVCCGWVQEAATLLGKAAKVKLTVAGGKVTVAGPTNKAVVVIPDVKAGKSIVHVIDTVVGSTACCCGVREQVAPALLDVVPAVSLFVPLPRCTRVIGLLGGQPRQEGWLVGTCPSHLTQPASTLP